jgi:preprotein translocase subunit SecD
LLVLFAVLAALTGIMFLQGPPTPKLALDLAGGTTVTLTAVTEAGKNPPSTQMQQAVNIIRDRVNGLGVSEAEVTRQGDNHIVVQVPGTEDQKRIVDLIGTTAQLQFRQVYAVAAGSPQQQPVPAQSGSTSPSPSGSAEPSESPKPTGSASPPASASPTPSATASPRGRALSGALTAPSPSGSAAPSASAAPSGTPSLTPEQLQQLQQQMQQQQQQGQGDYAGIEDKAVIAQFEKLNCAASPDKKVPGADDPKKKWVAACEEDGSAKYILGPVRVEGKQVSGADAIPPNAQEGQTSWSVQLQFKSLGAKQFGDLTTQAYQAYQANPSSPQRQISIVLDGQVVSAPVIERGAITGGTASIDGPPQSFNQSYADGLANVLKYGALPLKFEKSSIETVSSTLGDDQLRGGLLAGAIGLVLVVVYSMVYYRGLGIVSVFSLVVASIITYLAVVILGENVGFRLSLAHVIGLIVSIGITADSFIVYFERMRDELRQGRALRPTVESAWKRARRTILVADAVTFIAAVVLYMLAVGGVAGFAFAMGLTTLIDVVVVFFFTKPLVALLAKTKFFAKGHKWSGLDPARLRRTVPAGPAAPSTAVTKGI